MFDFICAFWGFEFSNTDELARFLGDGEQMGVIIDSNSVTGCQFASIVMSPELGREPDDQVFIVMEPGGRSSFVALANDKIVRAWAVQGCGSVIIRRAGSGLAEIFDSTYAKPTHGLK